MVALNWFDLSSAFWLKAWQINKPTMAAESPAVGKDDKDNEVETSNLLEGLASELEDIPGIRKATMKNQSLLQWLAPNKVGVVTNKSLKLNAHVLEVILKKWCPVGPDRKTVPVGFLKVEAGCQIPNNSSQVCLKCWLKVSFFQQDPFEFDYWPLQINQLRELLSIPENVALTHCEAHAIKSFVSRLIRMHDGSKKRDTFLHSYSQDLIHLRGGY